MYLIDTVVLSELRKPRRDANLVAWLERRRTSSLFISVVTIGEIERGVCAADAGAIAAMFPDLSVTERGRPAGSRMSFCV